MSDERYNQIKRLHRRHDLKPDEQFWSAIWAEGAVSPVEFAVYHDEFTRRKDSLWRLPSDPQMAVFA